MPYKISGTLGVAGELVVLTSDISVESVTDKLAGDYELIVSGAGEKTVFIRAATGEIEGYGGVVPYYVPGPPGARSYTFLFHNPDNDVEGVILETDDYVTTVVSGTQRDLDPLTYVHSAAILSDGRAVVPAYHDASGYEVVVVCYEAGTTTLDWEYIIPSSALAYMADIAILNDGNLLVAWSDYDLYEPYFAIVSSSGTLVKGMTITDTVVSGSGSDYDYHVNAVPLADGGFFTSWADDSSGLMWASTWEADGTNREPTTTISGLGEGSNPIQMPASGTGDYSGWVVCPDVNTSSVSMYNPDDLTDNLEQIDIGITTSQSTLRMVVAPSYTDRVAIVWAQGDDTVVSLLDDTGTTVAGYDAKLVIEDARPSDFIALPDGTFLLQFNDDGVLEYGQSYYILNDTFGVVSSGTAFTGITELTYETIRGSAGTY